MKEIYKKSVVWSVVLLCIVCDIALILLASVTISFLATIYPARQAARLMPVEAIRHE